MFAEFPWEALATLLTGLMAVVGAVIVGRRQLLISDKQTEILDRQTRLQETSIRVDLLDRREACVDMLREIVQEWSQNSTLSDEKWKLFHNLLQRAQLLYPQALVQEIIAAVDGLFWEKHWLARAQQYREKGDEATGMEKMDQSFEEGDKVMRIMPTLLDKLIAHSRVADW